MKTNELRHNKGRWNDLIDLLAMIWRGPGGSSRFRTTSWSLVVTAGRESTTSADAALAELCELYWYPVYAFVRRRGYSQDDASDLTQEFFSRLLEKQYLKDANPARGRFRSFLLGALRNFLANEWNREQCQKRGGGIGIIALDKAMAEGRYSLEPSNPETPESLFQRRWATEVLDRVMESFRESYRQEGRLNEFERLAPCLTGTAGVSYADLARQWNTTEGAVKVAVHRFRKHYRQVLRQNIAATVASEAEVDDEIRFLLSALGSS